MGVLPIGALAIFFDLYKMCILDKLLKPVCYLIFIGMMSASCSPRSTAIQQASTNNKIKLTDWQQEQNKQFRDSEKSPLKPDRIEDFQGLAFYPYHESFKVIAKLVRTPETPVFDMMTTSGKVKKYRQYGIVKFQLEDQDQQLNVYQSQSLMDSEEFRNYLFLPFYDATSGNGSYAGGRYISLSIPEGDTITIDFNEAYNPYCAYSDGYSCPITPPKNNLKDVSVLAGTKDYIK